MGKIRLWTAQEEAYLRKHYPLTTARMIAKKLNRSINAVRQRANLLGIPATDNISRRVTKGSCTRPNGYEWIQYNKGKPKAVFITMHGRKYRKSHYVWSQHHGNVPKDYIIIFKDGDCTNCNIENLDCVHKSFRFILSKHKDLNYELKMAVFAIHQIKNAIKNNR